MTTELNNASAAPLIHVAKIASCPSVSGMPVLQYQIGYEAGTTDRIFLRISGSDGNGKFNTDWWPLSAIERCLAEIPAEKTFPASALRPMFVGRSVNTHYFVLAALLDCGLLVRAPVPGDGYVRHTPEAWWRELSALIAAGTNLIPAASATSAGNLAAGRSKGPRKARSATPTAAPDA